MKIWWRTSLLLTFAVGSVLVAPLGAGATHSWGNYHWARTANPLNLALADNVNSAWDSYLVAASADWNRTPGAPVPKVLQTSVVVGGANPRTCKATSGRVQVCNASYGNNGWLGLAQIWISGSHITQGTVKVNDTYYNTAKYNTPAWRQMVMCQEIGHTFGLDHQDENQTNYNLGTCMDYTSTPAGSATMGPANTAPNQHDYEQLATIYSHLESPSTAGTSSSPSSRATGDVPGEWGRQVAGSETPGSVATYEREFGPGQRLVTFVVWAE